MYNEYFVELQPQSSQNQKSFYRKAFVREVYYAGGTVSFKLYSYETPICAISTSCKDAENVWFDVLCDEEDLSATTLRHIKAFCGMNKAEFCKYMGKNNLLDTKKAYHDYGCYFGDMYMIKIHYDAEEREERKGV